MNKIFDKVPLNAALATVWISMILPWFETTLGGKMVPANCVVLVAQKVPGLEAPVGVIYEVLDGTKIISKLDLTRNLVGLSSYGVFMYPLALAWLLFAVGCLTTTRRSGLCTKVTPVQAAYLLVGSIVAVGAVLGVHQQIPSWGFAIAAFGSAMLLQKAQNGDIKQKTD
eukprot:TRINITY_DN8232_c0_g1_i1.p2 TRINITY_DN8232_c0_g1~~TRINITY_DN8232_c0_g1_i1.p2  ORF type:complete len:183 (+),score=51.63 TRINITY_DN8232_c0_g1_i1:45-551(+)